MGERDDARHSIEQSRERMSAIVEELMRRATPRYLGDRLKEATVEKTMEWKEKASTSPMTLGILGGAIGAAAGALLASFMKGKEYEIENDYVYSRSRLMNDERSVPGGHLSSDVDVDVDVDTLVDEGGIRTKAMNKASDVKEKAVHVAGDVKEKVTDVGYRTKNYFFRAWDEQPLLVGAGFAILGALTAALVPVTESEIKMAEPVRRKAAEGVQKLGETIEQKIGAEEENKGFEGEGRMETASAEIEVEEDISIGTNEPIGKIGDGEDRPDLIH